MAGRIRVALIILVSVCTLAGVLLGAGAAILPWDGRIAEGVSVLGVDIGGLGGAEARSRLREALGAPCDRSITLTAGAQTREAALAELGIQPDVEATLQDAYAVGRSGSPLDRARRAARARWSGEEVSPAFALDEARARELLESFARQIDQAPLDAEARWDDLQKRVIVTPERQGAVLDAPASVAALRRELLPALASGRPLPRIVQLPYRARVPRVTAGMLAAVDSILGSSTTSYATSSGNRAHNLETAADAISGTVLRPGDVFSYNKTVGPRNADGGFVTAPVIINGQLKPGVGGGVCQVSTTLYNAALFANLKIIERSHHSLPIHYAPLGQDATVVYGAIDFRFQNSMTTPVVIETHHEGRRLTMRILGAGPAPAVRLERTGIYGFPGRTITRKDPSLPEGARVVEQKGKAGIAVTVIRVVGDGPDATREVISRDRYQGEPTVVRVGTGETSGEQPPSAPAATASEPPPTDDNAASPLQ